MTVLLTTALITVLVFGTLMLMRRNGPLRVQPIRAILGLRRRRAANSKAKPPVPTSQKSEFHSVSIVMDDQPCAAVREYADKTWLSSEAPLLPLRDCDQASCQCRYVHRADRRTDDVRRGYQSSLAMMATVGANDERRRSIGRRESDLTE